MPACKYNVPKHAAKFCKKRISKRIELMDKSNLMSHDSKANHLMQIFTQENNTQHALNQKQIKRLSKDLAVMNDV